MGDYIVEVKQSGQYTETCIFKFDELEYASNFARVAFEASDNAEVTIKFEKKLAKEEE